MNISIRIKDPLLRAYLHGLFELKQSGVFIVNMNTFTGSVICALAKPCEHPYKHPYQNDRTVVEFELPQSTYTTELRNKFLYLTASAESKINAVLQKEFECNFITFCVQGKTIGLQLKDTIEQFMVENQMDEFFLGEIDTLKKRQYRYNLSIMRKTQEKLRQKVYYALRRSIKSQHTPAST